MKTLKMRTFLVAAVAMVTFTAVGMFTASDVYAETWSEDQSIATNVTYDDRVCVADGENVKLTIAKGVTVNATKGIGIGAAGDCTGGKISLSWTNASDYIDTPGYIGSVTLEKDFYNEADNTVIPKGSIEDNASINSKKSTPINEGDVTIGGSWQGGNTKAEWDAVEGAAYYKVQASYEKNGYTASSQERRLDGKGGNAYDFGDFIAQKKDGNYSVVIRAYNENDLLIGFGSIEPKAFYEIEFEKQSLKADGTTGNTDGGFIQFDVDGAGGEILGDKVNGTETIYRPAGQAELKWSADSKQGFLIDSVTVDGIAVDGDTVNGVKKSGDTYSFQLDGNRVIKAVFKNTSGTKSIKLDVIHESIAKAVLAKVKNDDGGDCEISDLDATLEGTVITAHVSQAWTNEDAQTEFNDAIMAASSSNYIDSQSQDMLYFNNKAGLKKLTEYADDEALQEDNDENADIVPDSGKTYYALWQEPLKSAALIVEKPVCGTQVALSHEGGSPGTVSNQTNPPVIRARGNAGVKVDSTYWVNSYDSAGQTDYFEGGIAGGTTYKFVAELRPGCGYYLNKEDEVSITADNSSNIEIIDKFTIPTDPNDPVIGYLRLAGEVTAEHDYVNGVCKGCGKLKPSTPTPTPKPAPVPTKKDPSSVTLEPLKATYNGKAVVLPDPVVQGSSGAVTIQFYDAEGKELVATPVNAGTYYAEAFVAADDKYEAAASGKVQITIAKAANTLKAKAKKKTFKVRAKKNTVIAKKKAFKVTGNKGKVTFKKLKGNKKIKISKSGKITVKKGLRKGRIYTLKVRVTAAGDANYMAGSKAVALKIRVRK